ncbi:Hypothetical protein, putative [Bodo saltans]|uniref:Uncharacterized protein n=1 Tax=Bodo saltans TaxID=75058 RepID=A0A0S4IV75_BODSA|nr:Hypothetical protein, putative [Bodo saltans]|eukprot:CUF98299.1 Hypothetical protein, putative [Bodo saltans]
MQSIASSLVAAAVPTVAVPTTNPISTLASQQQSSREGLASSTVAHHTPPTAPLPRHRRPTSSSTARNHNNNCSLSMKSMNTGSFGGDTAGGGLSDHSLTPRGFAAVCVLPCGLRASPPREVFRTNPTSLLKLSQDRPGSHNGGLASSSSLRSSPRPSIGVVQSWFRNAHPAEMINNLRVLDCFPTLLASGTQHQQLCLDTDKSTPPASPTTTPTSHQHCHHNATASGDDAGSITVSPSTSFSLGGGGATTRGGTADQPDLPHNKKNNTIMTTTTTVGTGLHGQVHVYTSGLPHSLRKKHSHRQHQSSPSAAFARPSSSSTFGQARPAPPTAARQEQEAPASTPRLPHGGGSSPRSSASYSKGPHQHNNHSMPPIRASKPKAEDFLPPTPKLKSRRYVRQGSNNYLVPSSTAAADFTTTASSPSSAGRPPLNADQILLHNNNGKDAAAAVGTDELLSTQGNLIKLMYRALQEAVAAPPTVVAVPHHHHSGGSSEDDDNEQWRRAELFDELKVSMDAYQKLQERHHLHQTLS